MASPRGQRPNGQRLRRAAGSRADALRPLGQLDPLVTAAAAVGVGSRGPVLVHLVPTSLGEVFEAYRRSLAVCAKRSSLKIAVHSGHLERHFGADSLVMEIGRKELEGYVSSRSELPRETRKTSGVPAATPASPAGLS